MLGTNELDPTGVSAGKHFAAISPIRTACSMRGTAKQPASLRIALAGTAGGCADVTGKGPRNPRPSDPDPAGEQPQTSCSPLRQCGLRNDLMFERAKNVTKHGIEASLMDDVMAASRDFFYQPLEAKQEYSNLIGGKRFQMEGYGNDMVKFKDQILDWQDRLQLRVEPQDERNLAYWPKHPDSFRFISARLLEISSLFVIEVSNLRWSCSMINLVLQI
ncbi:S-norcoclaurine synthase 1 [Zea mays]|uniref:S-norcoclaurine synthase 1 n=1 Tax=Zea mays TaxID=4577 RepID=A0A317Y1N8_MAIZE|nr:S-norcoclaurine synthase 1 [Zea mays]